MGLRQASVNDTLSLKGSLFWGYLLLGIYKNHRLILMSGFEYLVIVKFHYNDPCY